MAFRIVAVCIDCWACEPLCPTGAIQAADPHVRIEPDLCLECQGYYPEPQCASICPVEGAILDSRGDPLNPPGSLTGIPAVALHASRGPLRWETLSPDRDNEVNNANQRP